jgi:hypothetical protein
MINHNIFGGTRFSWSIFGSPQKKSFAGYGHVPFIAKRKKKSVSKVEDVFMTKPAFLLVKSPFVLLKYA